MEGLILFYLLVCYLVKNVAEDTYHNVRGTTNPRRVAAEKRRRARQQSRTWGAMRTYCADLVEDATTQATESRRRKAAEKAALRDEAALDARLREAEELVGPKAEVPAVPGDGSFTVGCWSCHLCGSRGTRPTVEEAKADGEQHIRDEHGGNGSAEYRFADIPDHADENLAPQKDVAGPVATSPVPGPARQYPNNVYPFRAPMAPTLKESTVTVTDVSKTEIQGLTPAIDYAEQMAGWAGEHGTAGNEGYLAFLEGSKVTGEAVASAARMQQAFDLAAQAAEEHKAELEKQRGVQEQFMANPDAGDKEFQLGGV